MNLNLTLQANKTALTLNLTEKIDKPEETIYQAKTKQPKSSDESEPQDGIKKCETRKWKNKQTGE